MLAFTISIFGLAIILVEHFMPSWLPNGFSSWDQWVYMAVMSLSAVTSLWNWLRLGKLADMSHTIRDYEEQTLQNSKFSDSLLQEIQLLKSKADEHLADKEKLLDATRKLEAMTKELKFAKERTSLVESQLQMKEATRVEDGVLSLLSSLQKKGRFLDFVQGDISQYPDAQVGAAARVVHQGCAEALREFLEIHPIHEDPEGQVVKLQSDAQDLKYSFSGEPGTHLPENGRLIHRGWKTEKIQLPKRTKPMREDLLVITPAEIQL